MIVPHSLTMVFTTQFSHLIMSHQLSTLSTQSRRNFTSSIQSSTTRSRSSSGTLSGTTLSTGLEFMSKHQLSKLALTSLHVLHGCGPTLGKSSNVFQSTPYFSRLLLVGLGQSSRRNETASSSRRSGTYTHKVNGFYLSSSTSRTTCVFSQSQIPRRMSGNGTL